MAEQEPMYGRSIRLTKLGARAAVTVTYAYLAALLIAYYVPKAAKTVVFFSSVPVMGLVYWRFWSWVMSLRQRRRK